MKKVLATLVIVGLSATVAAAATYPTGWIYDVESNWTNWRDHTYASPYYDAAGNTYFTAHARSGSNWFYPYDSGAAGNNGPLVGNLWEKYGDHFTFTCDVKVETVNFTLDRVYFDFYGAGGGRFDETF